jgi:hypothetical protein
MNTALGKDLGTVQRKYKYYSKRLDTIMPTLGSTSGIVVEYHVLRALQTQGFNLNPTLDNKSVYDPDKLYAALGKYGKRPVLVADAKALEHAKAATMRVFGGTGKLEPIRDVKELEKAVKLEKASGAPEFVSKGEAFAKDLERMKRIASGTKAPEPCISYHRIQHGKVDLRHRNTHDKAIGPKTRLVWGYPLSMTLLEATYARPLIDWFLAERTPMAFGLHRHELASRMVRIENSSLRYCLDFSSYDASLHPALISFAFEVLRTHFGEVNYKEWDSIVHYFIHTRIILPDGYVYQKHQGVPSGSYFTQLIDSICNFLILQYMSFRLDGQPIYEDKVLVLGDDSLFGMATYHPMGLIQKICSELGISVNVVKSVIAKKSSDLSEFLGHVWFRGVVNRESSEIAKRMAFPERPLKLDPRLRIVTRILAYGSDAINAHLIIAKWSRYKGPNIMGIYFRDVLNEPILGWKEFQQSSNKRIFSFPKTALDQAYVGILV